MAERPNRAQRFLEVIVFIPSASLYTVHTVYHLSSLKLLVECLFCQLRVLARPFFFGLLLLPSLSSPAWTASRYTVSHLSSPGACRALNRNLAK